MTYLAGALAGLVCGWLGWRMGARACEDDYADLLYVRDVRIKMLEAQVETLKRCGGRRCASGMPGGA